jgi:hypothetical protein
MSNNDGCDPFLLCYFRFGKIRWSPSVLASTKSRRRIETAMIIVDREKITKTNPSEPSSRYWTIDRVVSFSRIDWLTAPNALVFLLINVEDNKGDYFDTRLMSDFFSVACMASQMRMRGTCQHRLLPRALRCSILFTQKYATML